MADVVALEVAIEQALGELIPEVSNHSEVTAATCPSPPKTLQKEPRSSQRMSNIGDPD
jgi:hypothetical protein